jgi:hypothetical protein
MSAGEEAGPRLSRVLQRFVSELPGSGDPGFVA